MNAVLLDRLKIVSKEEQEILSGREGINRSIYMHGNSEEIDKELLLEKGKLISLRPHTRFVHFPKHTHNYIEMVYMCRGETKHKINGEDIILKEGEILLLSQNATQEVFAASKEDIAINFIIWPQFFDTTIQLLGGEQNQIGSFLIDCLTSQNGGTGYFYFQVADILPIQNLIENLIWTLVNHQMNKRSINQLTMGILFLQLVNHTETLLTDSRYSNQQLMIAVLRYIEENYKEGQLQKLAEKLHYDESWLSREIKKQSGSTFTELLQNKRMNQACFLLKTTNMKVIDISEKVGYENLSYFHHIFKEKYGVSPHKYRTVK